ncbi:MAG: bacteriophage holin [Ignavibacteriales bacterium]|nr:bacteriophage holin [Ignavibacteriales bacterium]
MELRKRSLGIAIGLVWGFSVMLGTWYLLFIGAPGRKISLLGSFYFGYTYSFFGGFVGLVWGFIDGFVGGFLIAWIYNLVSKSIKPKTA